MFAAQTEMDIWYNIYSHYLYIQINHSWTVSLHYSSNIYFTVEDSTQIRTCWCRRSTTTRHKTTKKEKSIGPNQTKTQQLPYRTRYKTQNRAQTTPKKATTQHVTHTHTHTHNIDNPICVRETFKAHYMAQNKRRVVQSPVPKDAKDTRNVIIRNKQ